MNDRFPGPVPPGRLRPSERDTAWTAPGNGRPEPELIRLLRDVFPDPDPFVSADQLERAHHDDVKRLTLDQIDQERGRLRIAWFFELLSPWGYERLVKLDAAAERLRRHAARP